MRNALLLIDKLAKWKETSDSYELLLPGMLNFTSQIAPLLLHKTPKTRPLDYCIKEELKLPVPYLQARQIYIASELFENDSIESKWNTIEPHVHLTYVAGACIPLYENNLSSLEINDRIDNIVDQFIINPVGDLIGQNCNQETLWIQAPRKSPMCPLIAMILVHSKYLCTSSFDAILMILDYVEENKMNKRIMRKIVKEVIKINDMNKKIVTHLDYLLQLSDEPEYVSYINTLQVVYDRFDVDFTFIKSIMQDIMENNDFLPYIKNRFKKHCDVINFQLKLK